MTPLPAKILVIDDESQIRRFMKVALQANGYEMIEAETGEEAISLCATAHPDLIILDLGLPDIDGKLVLSRIREWSKIPIIILSVRSKESEKVELLDLGADDYIIKPFGVDELMARIRTALRHKINSEKGTVEFVTGDLKVDLLKREVTLGKVAVHLSKKEYLILTLFVQNAGLVLTHQQILKQVWGDAYAKETDYLRVFIRQLRQKIEPNPTHPVYIITESGVGYRLQVYER
jgi:two-component system, OmpR family, KDP operon response regulator KdpE